MAKRQNPLRRFLWRLLRRNATMHLFYPLMATAIVGTAHGWREGHHSLSDLWEYWKHGPIAEVLTIYFTFIFVVVLLMKRESDSKRIELAALDKALEGSIRYSTMGIISLREWFDPGSQMYLAKIFAYKQTDPHFEHNRVLLFVDQGSLGDALESFLDRPYARALVDIHASFGAKLYYLTPTEIQSIARDLTPGHRKSLGFVKRNEWPIVRRFLRKRPLFPLKKPRRLAFGVVHDQTGPRSVILFSKSRQDLEISLSSLDSAQPYLAFERAVMKLLTPDKEFATYLKR